jgi:tetratricopeptide (TPR) repeat protein
MEKLKSIAVNVAVAAVIGIILIWGNTLYRQHVQFDKGERGMAAGDFPAAVAGYESAIHMYTPGASLTEKSAEKLWQIGQMLEARGDIPRALIAYRSLRSSIYAITWIYTPGKEWIGRCDARIAALVQLQQGR